MYEAVIFDCDGVLVDSEAIASRVWSEAAGALGYPLAPAEALRRFRGGVMAQCVAWLEGRLGRPVPEGFVEGFRARLAQRFEQELRPVPGIEEVLRGLPVPFCVASNGPRAKMEVSLRAAGLMAHFEDRIFSAYELQVFKPDPGLFLAAARALGARPERCAVVEDSLLGVTAGVAAGMTVFAYAEPGEHAELAGAGAVVFSDMRELPALLHPQPVPCREYRPKCE